MKLAIRPIALRFVLTLSWLAVAAFPSQAVAQPDSSYTIKAENWIMWLSEKGRLSKELDKGLYNEFRIAAFIVQREWMEERELPVTTQDPKVLEEFTDFLQGKTIGEVIALREKMERKGLQRRLSQSREELANVEARLETDLTAQERDELKGAALSLKATIAEIEEKLSKG